MIQRLFMIIMMLVLSHTCMADQHDVFGTFLTEEKNSHIRIADCGDGAPCGTVVWINPNTLPNGETPESVRSKAGEPILGLQILQDFERKKNDWRGGSIYDPGKDKTYASRIKRLQNGSLEVKGCIAFLCQTQVWTQVDAAN